ncbi:MAG: hypothetical protein ACM3U0_02170 [archaeon]
MYSARSIISAIAFPAILFYSCSKPTAPEEPKPSYFSYLGISRLCWHDISVPYGLHDEYTAPQKMNFKAKVSYYTIAQSHLTYGNILGQYYNGYSMDEVPVLNVIYTPENKGAYNTGAGMGNAAMSWGGLQRLSAPEEMQYSPESKAIQIWMRIEKAPADAKLYIDLGRVSEDIIPNNRLDTEDKNFNGLLELGEDNGIDGLKDEQEASYNALTNPDPSADDFNFSPSSAIYTDINGTENNALSTDWGRLPDTEDLNGNYYLDTQNDFFRYEIPLSSDAKVNKYITETGADGWMKLRIPLSEYKFLSGTPAEYSLPVLKLWFSGVSERIHLQFAELRVAGK